MRLIKDKEEFHMLQVVADSSCDLPQELLEKHNIWVVPLEVTVDDENFTEGVDITPEIFYEKMAHSVNLPKTSQPPPVAFSKVFRKLSDLGPVICLTISSKLSGTYQSACLGQELSGVDATIFDSLNGSLGQGLQVLRVCELAKAGVNVSEVVAELDIYRKAMKTLVLLNTLKNIVKGGRLNKFQGNLARILDIRVLLHAVDGEVLPLAKAHGRKKFLDMVLHTIYELCPDMTGRYVGITHFNNLVDVDIIKQALVEKCHPHGFIVNHMGTTMATYAGEGGIIISF
jgi:DegV family protein with EDD domain